MTHPAPTENPESAAFQASVLEKLAAAGPKGVAMSNLASAREPELRVAQKAQLAQMEAAGQVQAQRKNSIVRYWLTGQMPPEVTPEEKADEILRRLLPEQRRGRLLTPGMIKSELLKGQGIPDSALRTCLRILEQERVLLKLSAGSTVYYTYAPAVRSLLLEDAASPPPAALAPPGPANTAVSAAASRQARAAEAPLPVTNQRVIEAYRSARMQRRLPDVEIARLQELLHCPVEELKIVVKRLCELGTFIPGKGDWSFATAAARAAAVVVQDEPHLFVRMKD
ncbi:MAG: hypothetical protein ACOYMN_19215 [Roseimicrobium sp.]